MAAFLGFGVRSDLFCCNLWAQVATVAAPVAAPAMAPAAAAMRRRRRRQTQFIIWKSRTFVATTTTATAAIELHCSVQGSTSGRQEWPVFAADTTSLMLQQRVAARLQFTTSGFESRYASVVHYLGRRFTLLVTVRNNQEIDQEFIVKITSRRL